MDDVVARYTIKFNDLASKGLLRTAGAMRGLSGAANVAAIGIAGLAVGAAALGVKVVGLTRDFAQYYDALGETADRTGLSATYLRDLRFAFTDMGLEAAQVDSALTKFNVTSGKMSSGGVPKALAAISDDFEFMGNTALNTEQKLQRALVTLGGIKDSGQQAAAAVALFGKGGAGIGPMTKDMGLLNAKMTAFSGAAGVVTQKMLDDADKFEYQMGLTKATVGGLALKIGGLAAPGITALMAKFTAFVSANEGAITADISTAFEEIGTALASIDYEAVGGALLKLIAYLPALVDGLGFVVDNAGALAAAFAGIKLAGFIGTIAPLISKSGILSTTFSVLRIAVVALAPLFASLAVPLLPVIAVLAAVAIAGYAIYKNWEQIKAFGISTFTALSTLAAAFGSAVVATFKSIITLAIAPFKAGIQLLKGDWRGALVTMQTAFSGFFTAIKNLGASGWAFVKGLFTAGVDALKVQINTLLTLYDSAAALVGGGPSTKLQLSTGAAAAAAPKAAAGRAQAMQVNVSINGGITGAKAVASVQVAGQKTRGNNRPVGLRA